MVSPTTTRNKGNSGGGTVSENSSSPPIPIKGQKDAKPDSTLPSPPSPPKGQKAKPVTPNMEEDQKGFVDYLPTPGSALPEKAQRKQESSRRDRANDIIARLEAIKGTKARLNALTEDVLMELRASIDTNLPLDFQVDQKSFMEWDQDSSDLGGYEYDAAQQKLIIKYLPRELHECIVDVFTSWFKEDVGPQFRKADVKLTTRSGKGLFYSSYTSQF
jgi:hypothetical protein